DRTISFSFFFHDTAPPATYPLSLHDALPISAARRRSRSARAARRRSDRSTRRPASPARRPPSAPAPTCIARGCSSRCRRAAPRRSEEHTSELQSLRHLVCRLLLEKKKQEKII